MLSLFHILKHLELKKGKINFKFVKKISKFFLKSMCQYKLPRIKNFDIFLNKSQFAVREASLHFTLLLSLLRKSQESNVRHGAHSVRAIYRRTKETKTRRPAGRSVNMTKTHRSVADPCCRAVLTSGRTDRNV